MMLISPTATQILALQRNGQIDPISESQELFAAASSPSVLIHADSTLTDKTEYLSQLLKDRKQLATLPNMFIHIERLLDQEISKVRKNMLNTTSSGTQMNISEPQGEKKIISERILIPVQQYPEYNFVGRILGPRGMTSKQLEAETDCKIMIRGRGSMRDKQKEEQYRGRPNWEHLNDELHVLIQCEDYENRARSKIERAKEEINKLLIPSPEGDDYIKKKQLTELAIINGTYRDPNLFAKKMQLQNNQIPMGAPLILTPSIQQNYFTEQISSSLPLDLFTANPTQSTLTDLPPGSFLPSGESNVFQFLTPFTTLDPMSGGFLTSGTPFYEYPNQAAYPFLTTTSSEPTGVATRTKPTTTSNPSRNFTSGNPVVSTRFQPYTIQPAHLKRS